MELLKSTSSTARSLRSLSSALQLVTSFKVGNAHGATDRRRQRKRMIEQDGDPIASRIFKGNETRERAPCVAV